jgi:hypothetical protein
LIRASLPHEILGRTATRIINEARGVNRIVYDITSKPPARSSGSDAAWDCETSGADYICKST